jgi:hypothetical protein
MHLKATLLQKVRIGQGTFLLSMMSLYDFSPGFAVFDVLCGVTFWRVFASKVGRFGLR